MQTQKMSLANIKGKLSRNEMKNVNGGVRVYVTCTCDKNGTITSITCTLGTPLSTCASNNGCGSWICPV